MAGFAKQGLYAAIRVGSNAILSPSSAMNQDDVTTDSKLARRLRLQTEGNCMTLHVPRFGLSMLLGVMAPVMLAGYWVLVPDASVEKPAVPRYESLPGGGHIALSPLVEFESPESARKRQIMIRLRAWKPALLVPLGFAVFFVSYRMLRLRIVLDRRNNTLRRGRRSICALDQIVSVELDDAPRIYVMNTLALALAGDRHLMLLYYDTPTDRALLRKAESIAAFLSVPLKTEMGVR
jgi:hypothetical protein